MNLKKLVQYLIKTVTTIIICITIIDISKAKKKVPTVFSLFHEEL